MDRIKNVEKIMVNIFENVDSTNWYKKTAEIAHMYGVASWCKFLALKRNLNYELGVIIGLLHDIGRIKFNEDGDLHDQISANESKKIILELNMFNEDEINIIYNSILTHSNKSSKGNDYQELTKDADVFENFIRIPKKINSLAKQNRVNLVKNELGIN